MKKIFSIILLIVLIAVIGNSQDIKPDSRGYIVKLGDQVEDFELKFLDGSVKKLSQLKSKVIVLNFFALWCVVCRKEIPHIESEIWQPLQKSGLAIIGVNYKETPEVAEKASLEMGMTYPVVLDEDGRIFEKFARGGVTRNIVLSEKLNIIFLTRLFDNEEFDNMKRIIYERLDANQKEASASNQEGCNMEAKILQDMAQTNKKIGVEYNGKHKIHLEGRIFSAKKKKLEIGIALFAEDIVSKKYDKQTKTFRIGYKHYTGVRIAVLPMTRFEVPVETENIVIFDIEK